MSKPLAILLDDDEFFHKTMDKVLSNLGFTLKCVKNGAEFRALPKTGADLYLIDLEIGDEDGLKIIEEIRQQDKKTPIMVTSGRKDPLAVTHSLEAGANDFLAKPFSRPLLAAKLSQFVKTSELAEQEEFLIQQDGSEHQATLRLETNVIYIDELGIGLRSPHLVPKGTVVKLEGTLPMALGAVSGCLVCVSTTALDTATETYDIYAEFENPSAEFLQQVRRYLAEAKGA